MKAKHIALILIPLNLILIYFIVDAIYSHVKFEELADNRKVENVEKLKDLRAVQIAYKKVYNNYANNFESLDDFLENGSMPIVKAIGEAPDSLTEVEALEAGIIARDTSYIDAKTYVFNEIHADLLAKAELASTTAEGAQIKEEIKALWNQFSIAQMRLIPHTENRSYNIDASNIEKSKVIVQVFEISASYGDIYTGLDAKNKGRDLQDLLKVGSMEEASLNGNWK